MSEIIDILEKLIEETKTITPELLNQISNKIIALDMADLSKNIPTILSKLGLLLQKNDGRSISDLLINNLPKIMDKLTSIEEIKYELSLTADLAFNLKLDKKGMGIRIKDGTISIGSEVEQPEFFMEIPTELLLKFFTGEENLMQELMAGERIKLWREREPYNAQKLLELVPLMSIILEKLNLDKWM